MELQLLLEEARRERERCLSGSLSNISSSYRNKPETLGLSGRGTTHPSLEDSIARGAAYRRPCENASVQTDPLERFDSLPRLAAPTARHSSSFGSPTAIVAAPSLGWSDADEVAQAEAIQAIQMLSRRAQPGDGDAVGSAPVQAERRPTFSDIRERESRPRESALEQVKCLELELDGKDAVIQALERKLVQRDADAQKAQYEIRRLQLQVEAERSAAKPAPGGSEYERVRALRMQVLELEEQLERKDMQILRVSGAARKQRGPFADEESTLCGSEKSEDRSVSSVPSTAAWRP